MPDLDLVAETSTGGVTAQIAVTGPAVQPAFQISSNPSLPEDEILSRILFQKSSGSLSAFQALQLANAVATLSGQADAFENVRKSLGVDSLDISTSAIGRRSGQRDPRDQRPGERRRHDRSEAPGQWSELEFRRHPPCQAPGGRRLRAAGRAPASASIGSTSRAIAPLRRPRALNRMRSASAAPERTKNVAIASGRRPAAARGRRDRHQPFRHGLDLRRFARTLERRASGADREPASVFRRRGLRHHPDQQFRGQPPAPDAAQARGPDARAQSSRR